MENNPLLKEFILIILASLILGASLSFPGFSSFLSSSIYFLIIISINVLAKKFRANNVEAKAETKLWIWYQYGFRKDAHFKKPLPMFWLPILLSLITNGLFLWPAILKFNVNAKTERVSKRHGLYRFSEMTDWHIATIAATGIFATLILAIVAYFLNFEILAQLAVYFAFFSLLPISELDGNRILFGSKILWFFLLIITTILLFGSWIIF